MSRRDAYRTPSHSPPRRRSTVSFSTALPSSTLPTSTQLVTHLGRDRQATRRRICRCGNRNHYAFRFSVRSCYELYYRAMLCIRCIGAYFLFEVPGQSLVGLIGGRRGQWLGGTMASAEHEPIIGVWGQSPQRGPGAEPLVRGRSPLKLKAFWSLDVQRRRQI